MLTEWYIINFFGIDSKYYTNEYVAYLWEESANEEYMKSGIFVATAIMIRRLVCGEIRGCDLGETVHTLTTSRNPAEVLSSESFYNSFINVVNSVRTKLDNPNMTLSTLEINYFYFTDVSI